MVSEPVSIPHVHSIAEIAAALAKATNIDQTYWRLGFTVDGQAAASQPAWAQHRAALTGCQPGPFPLMPRLVFPVDSRSPNEGLTSALRDAGRLFDLDLLPLWRGTLLRLYVWRRFPDEGGITRWHVVCSCAPQLAGELLEPRQAPVPLGRLL